MMTVLITVRWLHSKKKPNLKSACSGTKPQRGLPLPQAGKENKESNSAGSLKYFPRCASL